MRVGIVGCGIRGLLFERALRSLASVEVVGMCDPSPSSRSAAGQQFSGMVTEDHRSLYEIGLDAAIIATPDFAHHGPAVDAARAGLHLMIEKPLATSVLEAEEIRDAVAAAGVSCLVAFENRWNPYFSRIRQMIDAGEFGELISLTAILSNTYYVPTTMLSWAASSSPAWFLMPHTVDLALWLSDASPVSVSAKGHRGVLERRGIDTWDAAHALLELSNGAVVNLQSSWTLPDSSPSIVDFRVEICGTKGSAQIDLTDQGLRTATSRYGTHWCLPAVIDGEEQSMAAWMVQSWARSLVSGAPVTPGADHGVVVTAVVDAVHRSMTENRQILL